MSDCQFPSQGLLDSVSAQVQQGRARYLPPSKRTLRSAECWVQSVMADGVVKNEEIKKMRIQWIKLVGVI